MEGNIKSHVVAYPNGTGQMTFVQSTRPSLAYDCIDYVTEYNNIEYARKCSDIIRDELRKEIDYDPLLFLSKREHELFSWKYWQHVGQHVFPSLHVTLFWMTANMSLMP